MQCCKILHSFVEDVLICWSTVGNIVFFSNRSGSGIEATSQTSTSSEQTSWEKYPLIIFIFIDVPAALETCAIGRIICQTQNYTYINAGNCQVAKESYFPRWKPNNYSINRVLIFYTLLSKRWFIKVPDAYFCFCKMFFSPRNIFFIKYTNTNNTI